MDNAIVTRSCITDAPLNGAGDELKAGEYADALAGFIGNANTPVTIGIQGGWGSGKTSLFSLLRSRLRQKGIACITVNAWEHSLFRDDNGKSIVVLSLLNGMIEAIGALARSEGTRMDRHTAKTIEKEVHGANGILKTIGRLLPTVAQVGISLAVPGVNLPSLQKAPENAAEEETPSLAEQIHQLRKKLDCLVQLLPLSTEASPRLVVFIDDLDRVPPPTAVEILDVTKNIFDIEGCVFVLAIDYEVVVKGLEAKFGTRTNDNEREFRQYFDKIIQIPFTMPIGAFSREINALLRNMLRTLPLGSKGENGGELDEQTLKSLAKTARLATGSIPRSIKRIVNTLSLLAYIEKKKQGGQENATPKMLEARFIIVALHINYPEICARLMERLDFTRWTINDLDESWDLNHAENGKKLEALEKSTELGKYFDEDWEKVVYCLCAKSDWLSRNAVNISRILNQLREVLGSLDADAENSDASETESDALSGSALSILTDIMDSIRVVSIDSELQNAQMDNAAQKQDDVTRFCRMVDERVRKRLPDLTFCDAPQAISAEWNDEEEARQYVVPFEGDHTEYGIEWYPNNNTIDIYLALD